MFRLSKLLSSPLVVSQADFNSIIAVTGLSGHAFGSWAYEKSTMWLRDNLPIAIQNKARILIWGYDSQCIGDPADFPDKVLLDYAIGFKDELVDLRKNHPQVRLHYPGLRMKQKITDYAIGSQSTRYLNR